MLQKNDEQKAREPMETPAVPRDETDYVSYVLRLWCERDGAGRWRASLQNVDTGQRTGFACPDKLFQYLLHEMIGEDDGAGTDSQSA